MTTPFEKYGKTPRLYRDVHITEKIDGTNCQITFIPYILTEEGMGFEPGYTCIFNSIDTPVAMYCGSRNRIITPGKGTDNYGFAGWASEMALPLYQVLGNGRHYGEWFGHGIARGYGLTEKRWALFSPRWYQPAAAGILPPQVTVVPLIKQARFDTVDFDREVLKLVAHGSYASPGFMDPEGIIVHHSASGQVYKLLAESVLTGDSDYVKDPSPEEIQ